MKKVIISLLICGFANLFPQHKFTLEESLQLGLKNSKNLKISKSKILGSEAKITETTSQLLPRLSFNAGYTRLSDVPPFEVKLPIFPAPVKIQDVVLNNYSFKVSMQQPLFTGFRLLSLKSASEKFRDAFAADYDKDANEEAFNIINAYWNYFKAQKLKDYLDENLKQVEAHLTDTKNFLANDLVTKNDLLKLDVQYASLKLKQIEAENSLNTSRALFNKVLGLPISDQTEIESRDPKLENTVYNYDSLLTSALQSRFELLALDYRVQAGSENVNAAASGWYPSIFLFSDYYYNRPNQRIMPTLDRFKDTWDAGVTLSWDIWNWGYNSSQVEQARQNLNQLNTNKELLKENIEVEVYNNFMALNAARNKIEVAKTGLAQADENYRGINEKYNVQYATSTDLIDAETSRLQSQTDLINSLVDYETALARLLKSVGKKIY
jgi:outer membrane protein TolC